MKKLFLVAIALLYLHRLPAQWNMNTSVNLELAGVPMADMQALTTSSGKTWVAFYHQNGSNYDMRAQLIDANGYKLLGPDGVLVSNKPSGSATFVFNICKDQSDNLVIAFQEQRVGTTYSAVAYKISTAGAQLWGPDGVVLGDGLAPYPATITNNDVIVAWNESTTNTLFMQKITAAGATAWASPVQVRVGTTATTRGQAVPNLNGAFTLVFQKRGVGISTTLYAQRYDANGNPAWANPVQLGTETTSGARYYSVTSENDTSYCGYYSAAGSRFNSWLQRINPDGALPYGGNGSNFNTATSGSDPYQQTTNIALTPGSPYIWSLCTFSNTNQNQYGVYVQKFLKADGSRQFGNSALNVYPISTSFDTQAGSVSLINDAPMFMTYDVNYKIYATRLDANGAFVWPGNRIEMSSTTAGGSTPKGRFSFTGLGNNQAVAAWYENRGDYRGYAQNITPGGLFGVRVTTQGSVPATITTAGGTLQMVATVYPASASQSVNWSIVPGTGNATINSSGLVTAQANGTVWAKAISVQDNTVTDSLQITISNQSGVTPTSLTVATQGGVPATITTNGGTLQMTATVLPAGASQSVTWSIVPVTGSATISTGGLVTATTNGTVYAKAVSQANPAVKDSLLVTISNQFVQVTSLAVTTQGGVPATITTNGGTLQMVATVTPGNATNPAVTWSIVPVTGTATISTAGLVTAQTNGTVWAKAVSQSNAAAKDSLLVTISNQFVQVTSLAVTTQGGVPATITTNGGTLQMVATVTPGNATNPAVTWSIVPVTGTATISTAGLVTAQTNGTVWAKAISQSNAAAKDSLLITISNQVVTGVGGPSLPGSAIRCYPNPSAGQLNLSGDKGHPSFVLRVSDISGRVVFQKAIPLNGLRNGVSLDLSSIAAGIYLLNFPGTGYTTTPWEKR